MKEVPCRHLPPSLEEPRRWLVPEVVGGRVRGKKYHKGKGSVEPSGEAGADGG